MARYIDAEKVEKWSWQEPRYSDSINDRTDLRDFLKSLPTLSPDDLRPVGKWIALEPEIGLYGCSRCEHMILRAECNYCPNCGAKMKGE